MNYFEDEIPKYRKKRQKNKVKKVDHKHEYRNALLNIEKNDSYYLCRYCTICGRIDNYWSEPVPLDNGYIRDMTKEELLKKYRKYEIKTINDYCDKYVIV